MNYKIVIAGILGLGIGALLNYLVNRASNKELLEALKKELVLLQPSAGGRAIKSERQIELESQIKILESR